MDNLAIYNKLRDVPAQARKQIVGGRLQGFTDINPMWRIKKLTELFGPAGLGWYINIIKFWTEEVNQGEITAFCQIELYVQYPQNVWSKPIPGIGGSSLVTRESKGLRTNDEAYKMAYTDAISVACKALGMGADVYYDKDITKYNIRTTIATPPIDFPVNNKATWDKCVAFLRQGGDINLIKKRYTLDTEIEKKLLWTAGVKKE